MNSQVALTAEEKGTIKRTHEAQERLRRFLEGKKGSKYPAEERKCLEFSTIEDFEKIWKHTQQRRDDFNEDHEHGIGRAVRATTNFADVAYGVLRTMNPMLELIKDLGAPYGGMAVGTISFLFVIARNRARLERRITATLIKIQDRIPGLGVMKRIYNDDNFLDQTLQSQIVKTYSSFINFCMETTMFFSQSGPRRWLRAIQGSTVLDELEEQVKSSLVKVRYLCEELLNKNVDEVKAMIKGQEVDIKQLREQNGELLNGRDGDRVRLIRNLLQLETFTQEEQLEDLTKYQGELKAHSERDWNELQCMDGRFLEENADFKKWLSPASASHMLILVGRNFHNNDFMCWVSPVALEAFQGLRQQKPENPRKEMVAFYITGRREHECLPQVFCAILIQLLLQNSEALRGDPWTEIYGRVKAFVQNHRDVQKSETTKRGRPRPENTCDQCRHRRNEAELDEELQKAALIMLSLIKESTVYIILDGVHKCQSSPDFKFRKALVKSMVRLIEDSKNLGVSVRVLATVSWADWRVDLEDRQDEFGQKDTNSVVVRTFEQRRDVG